MRIAAAALAAAALSGCAGFAARVVDAQLEDYVRDAGPPPATPVRHALERLPFGEYWTGIVFNGEKIGFAHVTIGPEPGADGQFAIRSEASFVLRFLGVEKRVQLKSRDTVDGDLALRRFAYDYLIDGSRMQVEGRVEPGALVATVVTAGQPHAQRLALPGRIYPSSALALVPALRGLAPGREYRYRVYNGELQAIAEVRQRVLGYESSTLFEGNAFRVETKMQGQRTLTWIDDRGRPVFELALQGAMISALEEEGAAQRYVALAALNKQESLVEFSIVRPAERIADPRQVTRMRVALAGLAALPPSDSRQRCDREHAQIVCEMRAAGFGGDANPANPANPRHLGASVTVQSRDPEIVRASREIVADARAARERIERIVRWMDANVEKAPVDVFSALDVLATRRAECQGHAYLYAALARAAGIPTRIVNGLAYSAEFDGFLYHTWAESLVEGRWQAVDPTFGQLIADATHVRLFEGETLAELAPILEIVGRLAARVLAYEHAAR